MSLDQWANKAQRGSKVRPACKDRLVSKDQQAQQERLEQEAQRVLQALRDLPDQLEPMAPTALVVSQAQWDRLAQLVTPEQLDQLAQRVLLVPTEPMEIQGRQVLLDPRA